MLRLLRIINQTFRLVPYLILVFLMTSCEKEEEFIFTLLDGDIALFSQEQVNEFAAEKITYLRGNLTLEGSTITDISGLRLLTGIEGSLTIRNTQITDVDAFSNVTRLDGELLIERNQSLENLNGFSPIESSDSELMTLEVWGNPKLTVINQFNSFDKIEGAVNIRNNESLIEVDFSGLEEAGSVSVSDNPLLSDLSGFSKLRRVEYLTVSLSSVIVTLVDLNLERVGEIHISNLSNLPNLNGLESIGEVENIIISDCPLITEIDQFSEIGELDGMLSLSGNLSLSSVDFRQLNSVKHLHLGLTQLEDFSGFIRLTMIDGDLELLLNDRLTGLDDLNVSAITGNLWLEGNPQITSLEVIARLDSLGSLTVQRSAITDFKGLENAKVLHSISLSDNLLLESLQGLQNLRLVESSIFLKNSPMLTSLEGLNALESLGNSINIYDCTSLTDYCALELLVTDGVNAFSTIERNAYNPTLEDIMNGDCRQ